MQASLGSPITCPRLPQFPTCPWLSGVLANPCLHPPPPPTSPVPLACDMEGEKTGVGGRCKLGLTCCVILGKSPHLGGLSLLIYTDGPRGGSSPGGSPGREL